LICHSQSTNGERKGDAAFGVKNGEMLESESVHLGAALGQPLSIREMSDKTKNPAVILTPCF